MGRRGRGGAWLGSGHGGVKGERGGGALAAGEGESGVEPRQDGTIEVEHSGAMAR